MSRFSVYPFAMQQAVWATVTTIRLLVLAILIQAMTPGVALSAISRTLDEGLPPRVIEITHKQIEYYLGTNDFKGVPLLDGTIDWNSFTNWPDQFVFKGHTYRLKLTDTSGGDYFVRIKSRADIRPGMRFLARYSTDTDFPPPLGVSSVWRGDGSVSERIVNVSGVRVFGHQFFPTGRLSMFARHDAETKHYSLEFFDDSGRLMGTATSTATKQKCEWEGVVIEHDTLLKKSSELYKQFEK